MVNDKLLPHVIWFCARGEKPASQKRKKTVGVTKRIINERKGSHHLRESNTGHGTERRML